MYVQFNEAFSTFASYILATFYIGVSCLSSLPFLSCVSALMSMFVHLLCFNRKFLKGNVNVFAFLLSESLCVYVYKQV